MSDRKLVSIGRMSLLVGVLEKQLRKLADRHPDKVPHTKVGRQRVFDVADVAVIRAACVEAGYLRPEPEAAAVAVG